MLKHHENRANKDEMMSREEYVQLMATLRPQVSEKLGVCVILLHLSQNLTVLALDSVQSHDRLAVYSLHGGRKSSYLFRGIVSFWWRDGAFVERADGRYSDQGCTCRVRVFRRRTVTASGDFEPACRLILVEGRGYVMLFFLQPKP